MLPHGTVTFLFTDIEGSTRLLTRFPGAYAEALADHRRLLRAAFAAHGGREVHVEGDGFFVVFERAGDAVAAAVAGQRALAAHGWPDGMDVRVRMGAHTGEVAVRDGDYVGLDVHRAARICAAGHGGQVLVSGSTCAVVAGDLPPDVGLQDVGEHWLKDLDRPQHLFQVVAGGLRPDFPPPGSLRRASGGAAGLPAPPNRTIGRDDDLRAIAARLGSAGGVRLLTLTGTGGVGKTRLAQEAARAVAPDFAAGARFVSLAPLSRAEDVPAALMRSLRVSPVAGESSEQAVTRYLSPKRLLLVLDNFEHLLAAASFVADLLAACPSLTVLTTSREPLSLAGEQRHPVAPLALPLAGGDADALARAPAVALFAERARVQAPGFAVTAANAAAVAEVCRRVDGLPLAVELAAARCGVLSPAEIAERLDSALSVLGHGPRDAPARQQTLRATIGWSHGLLSAGDQDCFARFAVFAGGATVEAAETVTGADLDTLDRLVAKSLLLRGRQETTRLEMLETIRAYATERLAGTEGADAVRERHYRHFLALAQRHATERALWGAGSSTHLARLDADVDNLHAALAWAVEQPSAEPALRMCAALGWYWRIRDRYGDAVTWIDRSLGMPGAEAHPQLRAHALCIKGWCLWPLGRAAEQPAHLAAAEAAARATGDALTVSRALELRASRAASAGASAIADAYAGEAAAAAEAAGDRWAIALAACGKALASDTLADLRERTERAASLLEETGDLYHLADLLSSATYAALCMSGDGDAKTFVDRAVPLTRELDNAYAWMMVRGNFGLVALFTGETAAAGDAFREELELCRELVVRPFALEGLMGLAAVAAVEGDTHRAARLLGAAGAHRYGDAPDDAEARLERLFFAPARSRHGAVEWDAAAREGAALSFEDAIAYALESP